MGPNDVCEFHMTFMVWSKTQRFYKMFLYLSARTLTTISPLPSCINLQMIVDDCIFPLHECHNDKFLCHLNTRTTNLFYLMYLRFATFSALSRSNCINLLTNFFSPNIIVFHREKCKQTVYFGENWFEFMIVFT